MEYILLIVGFIMLIKGADYFVEGASGIAKIMKISPLLIGLTVVAFGTSAPEAAVSISAAIKGSNGIVLGNVIGSNLMNMTLIIGITAILYPIYIENQTIKKEIPFAILASTALLIMASDKFLNNQEAVIDKGDGLILLLIFSIFIHYILEVVGNKDKIISNNLIPKTNNEEKKEIPKRSIFMNIIYTIMGLGVVIWGGNIVVSSGTKIATSFGVSETLIGLTIVAIGTSLPELVTSIVASIKKQTDIAVGNIVGSSLFNVLFILGVSAIVSPVLIDPELIFEIFINLALTIALLIMAKTGFRIVRIEGIILCLIYFVYIAFIISTRAI